MNAVLNKVPLPMSGLVLGLLSLGNLCLQYQLPLLARFFASFGFVLLLLLLSKIIFSCKNTFIQLQQPMVTAVSPTLTMAIMVAATYFNRVASLHHLAYAIWLTAFVIHLLLMIYFSYRVVLKPLLSGEKWQWNQFYPSWFILYIGLGIVPITGQAFSPLISEILLITSFFLYLILLPMVLYRVLIFKRFEAATKPLIAITCAPSSLLLSGYLAGHSTPNIELLMAWIILAQALYLLVLVLLPKLMPKQFYPSWSALTFPFVICATGLKLALPYFSGTLYSLLSIAAHIELIIAIIMVSLALYHYMKYLLPLLLKIEAPTKA